ncbi:RNA-binding protein FUS-like [Nymphalis io]|uniref:RNA-binding protein FUS-like n=1 Tax=Inachis io TaxID=171585 RepID=UPI002167F9BA|nr:RNA-binding protein FUS-like [Nymphalis io]
MAKLVFISGFCCLAIAVQAATYRDAQLHRVERSPHYGVHYHDNQPLFAPPPFPPPPPPFIYRTHNWSGVGRSNGGVFSGAAASAQSEIPTSNAAFSLAEAGAVQGQFEGQSAENNDNTGSVGLKNAGHYSSKSSESISRQLGSGSADYLKRKSGNSYSGGYSGLNSHITRDESSTFSGQSNLNSASNGYGQESNGGYGQSSSFNSGYAGNIGGHGSGYKKNFKESRYSVQNGEGNQFESQQNGVGRDQRNFDEGRLSYSGGFSGSQAQSSSSENSGQYAASQGSAQSGSNGYGYGNVNRRSEVRDYENQAGGSETFKSQQLNSTAGSEQSAGYNAGVAGQTALSSSNRGAGYGQHQSALHGALELASQGLQAAKNSECSTCQKSTYALSNAKSHSGSAIALSIGG